MLSLKIITACSLILCFIGTCFAQESSNRQNPSIEEKSVKIENKEPSKPGEYASISPSNSLAASDQLSKPKDWVVEIKTYGGYSGQSDKSIRISSKGAVTLNKNGTSQKQEIPADELAEMSQRVAVVNSINIFGGYSGMCSDCFVTVFTLYQREESGIFKMRVFSWDVTDYEKVPEDIKLLYASIVKAFPESK